jgi:HEPN domain-containing protein
MTNHSLSSSYLAKAKVRLAMLSFLLERESYSDVVREAQEAVELVLKAMLREIGVEPPKWHDVGELLVAYAERFPVSIRTRITRLAEISKWLREERELAFYGDDDVIPSEHYDRTQAERAINDASFAVETAEQVIRK